MEHGESMMRLRDFLGIGEGTHLRSYSDGWFSGAVVGSAAAVAVVLVDVASTRGHVAIACQLAVLALSLAMARLEIAKARRLDRELEHDRKALEQTEAASLYWAGECGRLTGEAGAKRGTVAAEGAR